jgi:hypothetical protein
MVGSFIILDIFIGVGEIIDNIILCLSLMLYQLLYSLKLINSHRPTNKMIKIYLHKSMINKQIIDSFNLLLNFKNYYLIMHINTIYFILIFFTYVFL